MTSARPKLLIFARAPSPYRIAQHRRIVRLIPQVELHSVFLREKNWQPFDNTLPGEINPLVLDAGAGDPPRGYASRAHDRALGRRINAWIDQQRPAAAVVTGYASPALTAAIDRLRQLDIPRYMFTDSNARGDHASGLKGLAKKLFVSRVVSKLSGLMPCGTLGELYYHRYGGKKLPVFYCPHEPDYDHLDTINEADARATAAEFALAPDRKRIVFCGRLAPEKRVDLLLDAFATIAESRPDWDLLIVGDGALRQEMENRAAKVPGRVVFAGFVGDPDTLARLYKSSHLLCLPSDFEPWAAVLPEAAGCGLPIVASDVVGAAADVIFEGVNGFRFRSGDAADLADKLARATGDDTYPLLVEGAPVALAEFRRGFDSVEGYRRMLVHERVIEDTGSTLPEKTRSAETVAAFRARKGLADA